MPALCAAGVIVHVCESGRDDECGHEAECAMDPCGNVVTRPTDSHELMPDFSTQLVAAPITFFFIDPRVLTPIIWSSPPRSTIRAHSHDVLTATILLI